MRTECPAHCGRLQAPGKFLCRPCWGRVPKPLQDAVYATWRAYGRARRGSRGEMLAALKAYRESRRVALEALGVVDEPLAAEQRADVYRGRLRVVEGGEP